MENNITHLYAYQISELLEKKKIDPVILLEQFIENYEKASNQARYAFCKFLKKESLLEAESSWKRQKENNRLSIFDGIPTGWKDVIDIKNFPALAGSDLLLKTRINKIVKDATVVTRAKKKGIISLAKTSTVEFAFGGLGINSSSPYPPNLMIKGNYCPGGSSSGSATSVYSSLIPFAVGTDTAGSIRIPSAWHSLVGFKPTYGSIENHGVLPLSKSFDTLGTISKCVKDTQIFYNILSNRNYKFPNIKPEKITACVVDDFITTLLSSKERSIYENLICSLASKGVKIKRIKVPEFNIINSILRKKGGVVNFEAWNYWKNTIKTNMNNIDTNVASRFILGKNISSTQVGEIKEKITKLKRSVYKRFKKTEILLMPTVAIRPPKIDQVLQKKNYIYYNNLVLNNTRVANIFNLCAITMPIKKDYWFSFSLLAQAKEDKRLLCEAKVIECIINNY
ncbi:amidase [Alphaproteobacteria bacterium]|nr:amidase [Alphaproteobacteria bacterium]